MSTKKPGGRSIRDFAPLLQAEKTLVDACRVGQEAIISNDTPSSPTESNKIRASLLRFLILGGDEQTPVHEKGPLLRGAWIEGALDLHNAVTPHGINCSHCHFEATITLIDARIGGRFFLSGSRIVCAAESAIVADAANISGGVFLRHGFESNGLVRFLSARIGGCFDCQDATFSSSTHQCIVADGITVRRDLLLNDGLSCSGEVRLLGAEIGGNLFLRGAKIEVHKGVALAADRMRVNETAFLGPNFYTNGVVTIAGAQIGSNLDCGASNFASKEAISIVADRVVVSGSVFLNRKFQASGTVRLVGARIGGSLSCVDATFHANNVASLFAQEAIIDGGLVMQRLAKPAERVNLNNAKVGALVDDDSAWGDGLALDGFTYTLFGGNTVANAEARISWLDKQIPGHAYQRDQFRPQPWSQVQRVFRETGHLAQAQIVAIALEDRLRQIDRIGMAPKHWGLWRARPYRFLCNLLHKCFGLFAGYGYRPLRVVSWTAAIWFLCGTFYWFVALPPQSVFAPSNPIVFQHRDYEACVPDSREAKAENTKLKTGDPTAIIGAGNWYLCAKLREEYTGLSPFLYSLDAILPLVDLQQQKDWGPLIPSPNADWKSELLTISWKHVTRWIIWSETLFGWIASLLLVAMFSGLAKRRDE
jgi:hypothetical protein